MARAFRREVSTRSRNPERLFNASEARDRNAAIIKADLSDKRPMKLDIHTAVVIILDYLANTALFWYHSNMLTTRAPLMTPSFTSPYFPTI